VATNGKRRVVYAGALLAVGVLGGGCMQGEEDSSSSLKERREAQLRAQPFQSYGDGTLPQEIKLAPPQGTGGSGAEAQAAPAAPQGSGSMVGQPVQQQAGQSAGPAWQVPPGSSGTQAPAAPPQNSTTTTDPQPRPRRDSGSSEKN
jgi:hypothetical protein